ncbi:MAG: tRNA (adenosine(37)-N6)-threonylcarbamoyltransferase complex ATPase subunit type 1 TsaE [Desulfobulbus propionicus]|nr:MAG: tRNA (adenosine(37)-N6)-threonylcarbamoyltransferase complex ATPase subunit type 1 TsaE [Desulfobulbus propionicus]
MQHLGLEQVVKAGSLLAVVVEPGDILLLTGELGAGKTTLVQSLARALGVGDDQYVSSPSYALLHEYSGNLPLYHMDLYRLTGEDDVEAAGLVDYLDHGLCCIEWPDRLGSFTPDDALKIELQISGEHTRNLKIMPHGSSWQYRAQELAASLEKSL